MSAADILPDFATCLIEVARHAPLSATEETELSRRIQAGSSEARDALVVANLRLLGTLARKFRNLGFDRGELAAEGNRGLIRAVGRVEPECDFRFSARAVWWIRRAMIQAVERLPHAREPVDLQARRSAWRNTAAALATARGRAPTASEVAQRLGFDRGAVLSLKTAIELGGGEWLSLDNAGDEGWEAPLPADLAAKTADLLALRGQLAGLDERSREILELRFGLGTERPYRLIEVGAKYGLTRERVRQLQNRALDRLKTGNSIRLAAG